jgi:uncharacterized protein
MVEAALQARPSDALDRGALALNTLRVLILSDGVPAHERSSLGILAALAKHRSVEARVLPIREKRRGSRRLKRTLAGVLSFAAFWTTFYAVGGATRASLPVLRDVPSGGVDLVVSTGPRTAAANIAMARHLKAKNVYFGFAKWPSDGFYSVLLTPEHLRPHPHRAQVLRPSEIDATALPEARPLGKNGTERHACLLFGGQSKHYRYTTADFERLAERIVALRHEMPWLRWTLFDSRRTPKDEFDRLVEMVGASVDGIEFVRFAESGLLSNDAAFSSDLVLVTADSMSMLSESIASQRPTGILFADCYQPPGRDAIEHLAIISDRRAFPITFSGLTAEALLKGAAGLESPPHSQLDALYETVTRYGI